MMTSRSELPEHLRGDAEANNTMNEFVTPPRIKIVQPTARAPVSEKFSAGDTCLLPTLQEVAKKETPFLMVPLFFFPEYLETNPLEAETFIRDRSLDPNSEIARLSRDPEKRKRPWEKDSTKFISYVETLNFIVAIVGHEQLTGMIASIGFQRAEHKTGTSWTTSIKFKRVPMFGTVWEAKSAKRTNQRGTWWGYNIQGCQDDQGLVLDVDAFNEFKQLNEVFKQAHADKRLVIGTDEDELASSATTGDTGAF